MMITAIEVKKLFGVFTHRIDFDQSQNITLILGENGLGKTVILKLIKALGDNDLAAFREHVYEEFIFEFDDKSKLSVTRKAREKKAPEVEFSYFEPSKKKPLTYTLSDKDSSRIYRRIDRERFYNKSANMRVHSGEIDFLFDRYIPVELERLGIDAWYDSSVKAMYSTEEIIRKYAPYLPPEFTDYFLEDVAKWIRELSVKISVKLIETQRLLVKAEEGQYHSTVADYSKQLRMTINKKRSEATDLASNLDRTYPNRVISQINNSIKLNENELRESFIKLQEKRELLNNVGLLDTDEEQLQPITSPNFSSAILSEVLSVYIDDSNKKLDIYNDLSSRIKLFLDIINNRFTYKKLSIDKSEGFLFTSTINKKKIPLNGLSSGEQHELVLFFDLLFNTKKNSLLLIDEPEISLHISWQKQFINDLASVANLSNLIVVIATHSPDIIQNNWNLTVKLKGV